jgi:hypothetical protein
VWKVKRLSDNKEYALKRVGKSPPKLDADLIFHCGKIGKNDWAL